MATGKVAVNSISKSLFRLNYVCLVYIMLFFCVCIIWTVSISNISRYWCLFYAASLLVSRLFTRSQPQCHAPFNCTLNSDTFHHSSFLFYALELAYGRSWFSKSLHIHLWWMALSLILLHRFCVQSINSPLDDDSEAASIVHKKHNCVTSYTMRDSVVHNPKIWCWLLLFIR